MTWSTRSTHVVFVRHARRGWCKEHWQAHYWFRVSEALYEGCILCAAEMARGKTVDWFHQELSRDGRFTKLKEAYSG